MIGAEDFCWYVDHTLDQMVKIVIDLGDDRANRVPELPGANSPYAILTHSLGVVSWWGGKIVRGREVVRDRDAEFVASGSVADIAERAAAVREQFHADVLGADMSAPLPVPLTTDDAALPRGRSQGGALFHVYEELSQHLGQMELSRDIVALEA
jgi:hypothetical protein